MTQSLPVLLRSWASALLNLMPKPFVRTARRRRFLFLALISPGFVAVAAFPIHKDLTALAAGVIWCGAGWTWRAATEPKTAAPHDASTET